MASKLKPRSATKYLVALLVLTTLFVMVIAGCNGGGEKEETTHLTMGTTATTSSYYAYAVAASQVINSSVPGIQVTPVEGAGSLDNSERIVAGEYHLGVSDTSMNYLLLHGVEGYEAHEELRWMWLYNEPPMVWVTNKDIESIYDIEGKPFGLGPPGSGVAISIENTLTALGIEPDYYPGSLSDCAEALKNRQVVGMAKTGAGTKIPDASLMDIASSIDVKFHSFTDEEVAKVKEQFPYMHAFIQEPNVYPNQPEELKSLGFATGFVSSSKIPQETGYLIVKAIIEGKEQQEEVLPAVKDVDIAELTIRVAEGTYLHAGTVQYFKEIGYDVPDELIPPEYEE